MITEKINSIQSTATLLHKKAILNDDDYSAEKLMQIIMDINFIAGLKENNIHIKTIDNSEENEILKVKRKVPLWMKRKHQYNYIILNTFMQLSNHNKVPILLTQLEKKSNLGAVLFQRHYNLMKNIFEKNHAKVFTEDNGTITLWQPIEEFIKNIFSEEA